MKSFLTSFFKNKDYIGLSEFKKERNNMPKIKPEVSNNVERMALTGLIRRVN